jgi:hypothetical protein
MMGDILSPYHCEITIINRKISSEEKKKKKKNCLLREYILYLSKKSLKITKG